MNVYAINPEIIREDKLPFLLSILKVRKVICLLKECPSNCKSLLLYEAKYQTDYSEEEITENVKKAVHKFNAPIYSPIYDKGKWIHDFQVHDIYVNSRAYNPLYNIEYCDDDNVMILSTVSDVLKQFSNYSLNLLRKYASDFHYENRICFVQLSYEYISQNEGNFICYQFPTITSIYSRGTFYPLKRFYPMTSQINSKHSYELDASRSYSLSDLKSLKNANVKVARKFYDPLISYIDLKTKELFPLERDGVGLIDFFNTEEHVRKLFLSRIGELEEYKKEAQSYYDSCGSSHESDYYQSELDYIMGNGGDWID